MARAKNIYFCVELQQKACKKLSSVRFRRKNGVEIALGDEGGDVGNFFIHLWGAQI